MDSDEAYQCRPGTGLVHGLCLTLGFVVVYVTETVCLYGARFVQDLRMSLLGLVWKLNAIFALNNVNGNVWADIGVVWKLHGVSTGGQWKCMG